MRASRQNGHIPEAPLTTGDVARYCHTNLVQVNRWIKRDQLKAFRNPGGQFRIARSDFRQFLVRHGMPVVPEYFDEERGKKILVADDDPSVVEAIGFILRAQPEQYQVEVARDGYETLLKAGDFKPDLVILDIRMPKFDGVELCRRFKLNGAIGPGLKILAITGHSEAYDREYLLANGADDYLLKPFNKSTLLEHVRSLLHGRAGEPGQK